MLRPLKGIFSRLLRISTTNAPVELFKCVPRQ